jgi:hypothetical protein
MKDSCKSQDYRGEQTGEKSTVPGAERHRDEKKEKGLRRMSDPFNAIPQQKGGD